MFNSNTILKMDESEYMKERVDDQIKFYEKRANKYKNQFKFYYFFDVTLSALIPLLTLFTDFVSFIKFIIALLGTTTTIISALAITFKIRKNWIEYRTTQETLKHEKFLFMTKTTPYHTEEAFSLFVQNIELLISKENTNWAYYIQKNQTKGEGDG